MNIPELHISRLLILAFRNSNVLTFTMRELRIEDLVETVNLPLSATATQATGSQYSSAMTHSEFRRLKTIKVTVVFLLTQVACEYYP